MKNFKKKNENYFNYEILDIYIAILIIKLKVFMKKAFIFICAMGMLTSCTVARSIQLTGQPIGTKSGEATAVLVGDSSLRTAAKNGQITTAGGSEVITKFFIIPITKTKVYGE